MKILIILLLCVILLTSCDAPAGSIMGDLQKDNLLRDYNALVVERDNLQLEVNRLENTSANLTALRAEHNKLINNYTALQTQYAILEAYNQSQREQYDALLETFAMQFADKGDAITYLYKENIKLEEKHKELNTQIASVHSENVTILSANLTDNEYSAFYKGWKLWWGEFND